jgi:protein-disulfide isomerase
LRAHASVRGNFAPIEPRARLCHKHGEDGGVSNVNRKQLLIGLVALAVVAVGVASYFLFFSGNSSDAALPTGGEKYGIQITSRDRTMGSPKAPILMVEYAAPTCPHCAHFDMEIFPQFKQKFIDTGKVYYVFRVFPLSAVDVAAESIARCLPEDNYFQFIDLLFRNQSKWDPDGYDIPDVHSALVQMGSTAGLSADKVDACIGDQTVAKQVAQVGQDAQTKYQISGTPTFLINGQVHGPFVDYTELQDFITPMLSKK